MSSLLSPTPIKTMRMPSDPGEPEAPEAAFEVAMILNKEVWKAPNANSCLQVCTLGLDEMQALLTAKSVFIIATTWNAGSVAHEMGDLERCQLLVGEWQPPTNPLPVIRSYYQALFYEKLGVAEGKVGRKGRARPRPKASGQAQRQSRKVRRASNMRGRVRNGIYSANEQTAASNPSTRRAVKRSKSTTRIPVRPRRRSLRKRRS